MRTLHIGNIANNAYLAARKERSCGFDAHVISPEYDHVMGFPEWEELEFTRNRLNHFNGFSTNDGLFKRPHWFHSGSWTKICSDFSMVNQDKSSACRRFLNVALYRFTNKIRSVLKQIIPIKFRAKIVGQLAYKLRDAVLPAEEILSLFRQFDYVTLYGPYTSLSIHFPEIAFIAFEHGTLRDFIEADYPLNVACRNGFINAVANLITNQDCLPKAIKLGLAFPLATPHPIKDEDFPGLRSSRRNVFPGEEIKKILVPARHTIPLDIDVGKGSSEIYDAIEALITLRGQVCFELVEWGDNVQEAKNRLRPFEELGLVHWNELMSRPVLKKFMAKSLCVIDQLKIPAYGAITADAVGIGVPVITKHSCENDEIFFGSCAPVHHAENSKTIIEQIKKISLYSFGDLEDHQKKSAAWFDDNLSSDISHARRLKVYNHLDSLGNK